MPPQLTMNPNYLAMVRGVRDLHRLSADGKGDSPEADAIRDATDSAWESLSEIERRRIRNLSEDIFSLYETACVAQPMNPQAGSELADAVQARNNGEWDRALDLLRRRAGYIDPAMLCYLRGSIWLEAGDPATAAVFFQHAADLQPETDSYLALLLYSLDASDPTTARRRASEILDDASKYSPTVIARAADIEFKSTRTASESDAKKIFQRLIHVLTNSLTMFKPGDPSDYDGSSYMMTIALLGFAHEFLNEPQIALEYYSKGLQTDPTNNPLLVARGMLLYGTSPRAATDFETAIAHGSSVVWPYFFLAHDHMIHGRFEKCRGVCERALTLSGSPAVKSELSEWLAIAQSELGFPVEMIRAAFEDAIRHDPSNDRARRNQAAFEAAIGCKKSWETRTASLIRMSGLAERRFATAA